MATFLDLLKSKNTNTTNGPTIDRQNGGNWIITPGNPDSKFFPNQPQVDQQVDPVTGPITVRCERVLDRNRIDLFFSAIPSEDTRTLLKDQGFKFNPDTKAWYHKDCLVNRMFLAATFDLPDLMQDVYNDDVKPEIIEETELNPIWSKYKKQVNALLAADKTLDPADLMIKAIDCLYIQTFKEN